MQLIDGTVEIDGTRIESIQESADLVGADLGGEDWLICPGFVDAHLHLPQFDSIGVDGMDLLDWLERVIFPAETRWQDAGYAASMIERVLDQLLSFGTTAFAGYATVHHEAARAALRMTAERGFRAMLGQVLMDRNAPDALIRPAAQLLDEAASLEGSGRVETAITPRFAISCTPELLRGAGELAAQRRCPVQTHVSETERECRLVGELFDGVPYVEVYQRAGLLGRRSILAHGIWHDDREIELLRESETLIAHCPTANLFLQAGAMNRHGLEQAGVRTCLGSDVAGGPDRSMVRVARAMIDTCKRRADPVPSASEAWWQITTGNADALGWVDSGRVQSGAEADLLVCRPTVRWRDAPDPLGALLYAWDDRWLRATVLHGRIAHKAEQ